MPLGRGSPTMKADRVSGMPSETTKIGAWISLARLLMRDISSMPMRFTNYLLVGAAVGLISPMALRKHSWVDGR